MRSRMIAAPSYDISGCNSRQRGRHGSPIQERSWCRRRSGEAWIDDVTFAIVEADVAVTSLVPRASDQTQLAQQRAMYAGASPVPRNLAFELAVAYEWIGGNKLPR
jgi:hypothetical protein